MLEKCFVGSSHLNFPYRLTVGFLEKDVDSGVKVRGRGAGQKLKFYANTFSLTRPVLNPVELVPLTGNRFTNASEILQDLNSVRIML